MDIDVLNLFGIVSSTLGLLHTAIALLAMFLGALVIFNTKGTTTHKRLGYGYVVSMVLLNLTAFGIYNTGGFSLFHFFALVSFLTVILGMIPAWRRKKEKWYITHYYFMSWSVVGLYAAFWSEVGTRVLEMRYFWWAVLLATLLTCGIGALVINRQAKKLLN